MELDCARALTGRVDAHDPMLTARLATERVPRAQDAQKTGNDRMIVTFGVCQQKSMSLSEPWLLTRWSALNISTVAKMRSELAVPAPCQPRCGHAVGAVQIRAR
jgi:hypothetical protein